MSLSQALSAASAGLRATQAGMSIVAGNVANADTPGYVRKTPIQVVAAAGEGGISVRLAGINRELDQYLQRQLQTESSGASYAGLRAEFYTRLQAVYGVPGSSTALTSIFDKFTESLSSLATSPDSAAARTAVLGSAQVLAQQLNTMSSTIQGLRNDAELGLADATARANAAMKRIAEINWKLGASGANDATTATLLDERDRKISELSQIMDIKTVSTGNNQITVFTNSGIQLVGLEAAQLRFDAQTTIGATAQWNAEPSKRGVGTLTLTTSGGADIDLIANKSIRSGEMAAYLEMRDTTLVEAQAQLDEIAATLARALSDTTTAGAPVSVGAQDGFDVDIGGLVAGNQVTIDYLDTLTNTRRTISLVRVDDPAALPLDSAQSSTSRTIGIDFSGGMASVVNQLNAALGNTGLSFANPAGQTLRVLDDGSFNRISLSSVTATTTESGFAGGSVQLPFFTDGNDLYAGAITSGGHQRVGLAGRLSVNSDLIADPSRLVMYDAGTLAGDATRPAFILERLTQSSLDYSPQSGIGSPATPYSGSLSSFMRQVVSIQGDAAASAQSLSEGQALVLNSMQQRFDEKAAVNIDVEMATLLNLQNAYAANARVMTTVRDMIDILLRM